MKLKYLLTMYSEDEYYDKHNGCWDTKKHHDHQEFDLDDEDGLTSAIAYFMQEYPRGDYEIYIINDWRDCNGEPGCENGCGYEDKFDSIINKATQMFKKIAEEKRLREIEEKNEQKAKELERTKQEELKKLAELKAKWE